MRRASLQSGKPAGRMVRAGMVALSLMAAVGFGLGANTASAASLTQVSSFGSNPGALSMYKYVPDNVPSNAPLVVAMHGCTQTASDYYNGAGWQKYADMWGFILVYPADQQQQQPKQVLQLVPVQRLSPAGRVRRCPSSRWWTT